VSAAPPPPPEILTPEQRESLRRAGEGVRQAMDTFATGLREMLDNVDWEGLRANLRALQLPIGNGD
jgi:hypothetical protein